MFRAVSLSASIFSTSLAQLPGEREFSAYTWEHYKAEFGKTGGDDRRAVFEENLRQIVEHNSQESKEWFATVNKFSDYTREEFSIFVKGRKADKVQFGGVEQMYTPRSADVPDSIDWRQHDGVVTDVKDQGGCGSCWAFSAAETLESHLAIATGEAAPKLSPQQIVSCSPNPDHCGGSGGCDGSTQPLAFDYTKTAGITTEESYPYTQQTGTCETSKINPVAYNSGYTVLPTNNYPALVSAAGQEGPIAVSIAASGFAFQFYGGGILSNCNDFVMDHAVQLTGYGADGDNMYWTVRNSWGSSWGESGYIRFKRYGEGSEPCGTDSSPQDGDACEGDTTPRTYCGECGVLSSSSFPTGMSKTPGPPSPTPPTPSPPPTPTPPAPTPPAPTPTPPPAPTPGCADVEDDSYCSYVVDQQWCELLSDSCLDSCQCCSDSPPSYCSGKEAALV
jgi:cathepsin L